jgi:hypothetical protein
MKGIPAARCGRPQSFWRLKPISVFGDFAGSRCFRLLTLWIWAAKEFMELQSMNDGTDW